MTTKGLTPRRWQFSTRSMLLAVALLSALVALLVWFDRRFLAPPRHSAEIERMIHSLVGRRPPDMTRGQWGSAVAWTSNLHGNSMLRFQADGDEILAFEQRLRKRLEGEVDLSTIHWIWDEYARLTPQGENYQRFKPVMLEELEQVGPNDDPWGMRVP